MSSDDDEPHTQHASRQKATDDVFDYFEILSENSEKHLYDVQCNCCSKILRGCMAKRMRMHLGGQPLANVVPCPCAPKAFKTRYGGSAKIVSQSQRSLHEVFANQQAVRVYDA
jgi:hypothetical protein